MQSTFLATHVTAAALNGFRRMLKLLGACERTAPCLTLPSHGAVMLGLDFIVL